MAQENCLSKRELEVLNLLLQGKSNKLIAYSLGISVSTVEFHLKNIYAKCLVNSRVELIIKLANITANAEIQKLGSSIVETGIKLVDNREYQKLAMGWNSSAGSSFSRIDEVSEMKAVSNFKHIPVGVATTLITGFIWIFLLDHFGTMSPDSIRPWIAPVAVILALIGLCVGLMGKHRGNTLLKVGVSALLGSGLSPITILPLMGFVVLPLGKLAEKMGLINAATMPRDTADTLAIIAFIGVWLISGTAIGILTTVISFNKTQSVKAPGRMTEQSL